MAAFDDVRLPRWCRDWVYANAGAQKFALENAHIKSGGKVTEVDHIPYMPPGSNVTINHPSNGLGKILAAGAVASALVLGGLALWPDGEVAKPPPAAESEFRARLLDADGNEIWSGDVPRDGEIPIPLEGE